MPKLTYLTGVFCLFIVLLVFLSFVFDGKIAGIASRLQNPNLDYFMIWITFAGSTFFVLFFLTTLLLWHERKRKWILPLWAGLFFTWITVSFLKYAIPRARPFQLGFATLEIIKSTVSVNSSFPSLHAAAAFSALPVLDKEFPYFKSVWLLFACLVAFSRVYFSVHYLSDVLIGAFIGYSIGYFAVRLEEKYKYSRILFRMKNKR